MEEEINVFTGKTVDEAIYNGLIELGMPREDVDVEIITEGKKGLLGIGAVKAKVKITPKRSDGARAVEFIEGLLKIMGIEADPVIVSESEEGIVIDIKTQTSARVIGKRGDVLDAIQCMAGAVANIGRETYTKVLVDCENYRAQREETLKKLALKLAAKAVETGRKIMLEPMSKYERRIIHSVLTDNTEVKTVSEGKEPARYIVVIPNNAKPYDKGIRYGEKPRNEQRHGRGGKGGKGERRGDRKGGRGDRREKSSSPAPKRGKKEIHFGTFLGNSNDVKPE